MSGIGPTGFVPKTLEEIKDDLDAAFRGVFGAGIDLEADTSVWGNFIGIFAERLASGWQGIAAVYSEGSPDTADGINLDNIAAITGVARLPATFSRVNVTATRGSTVLIPAGQILSVVGSGLKFTNDAPGVIGGTSEVIQFRSVDTGPKLAPAGTLTVIETPIAGWTSATNPLDQYTKGTDLESDAAFRLRREKSLGQLGSATANAIRARVQGVTNVADAYVFENVSDTTDGNGVGPHSIEVIAEGGTDADVAAAIYGSKSAGIGTTGTTSVTVSDSSGFSQIIKFSRPTDFNIYVIANVTVDHSLFPADGEAQIKQAIVDWANLNLHTGGDVVSSALIPVIFSIPGVMDVSGLPLIGTTNPPVSSATMVLNNRQFPKFDTGRITVNVT